MEEAGSEREAAHTSTRGGQICCKHNEEAAATLEEAGSTADTMRRPHLHILQTATKEEDGAGRSPTRNRQLEHIHSRKEAAAKTHTQQI
jgi:hypothetical protein